MEADHNLLLCLRLARQLVRGPGHVLAPFIRSSYGRDTFKRHMKTGYPMAVMESPAFRNQFGLVAHMQKPH